MATRAHPGVPDGYPLFWAELDAGSGLWENVPDVVRAGFRVLLDLAHTVRDNSAANAQAASSSASELSGRLNEIRDAHERTAVSVEAAATAIAETGGALRRVASDVAATAARVERIDVLLDTKADAHAVAGASRATEDALASCASREDLAAAAGDTAALSADLRALREELAAERQRSADAAAELVRFRAEAQAGIIAATRAANEARQAVGAALSTLAALQQEQGRPQPAAAPVPLVGGPTLERLQADLSDVRAQVGRGRVDGATPAAAAARPPTCPPAAQVAATAARLESKADISAVNDVLASKANKDTVAAALHKKVGDPSGGGRGALQPPATPSACS